ncbi:MAG: hypothetical protein AAB870_01675, partial [Patescibacteria group bacterium]
MTPKQTLPPVPTSSSASGGVKTRTIIILGLFVVVASIVIYLYSSNRIPGLKNTLAPTAKQQEQTEGITSTSAYSQAQSRAHEWHNDATLAYLESSKEGITLATA